MKKYVYLAKSKDHEYYELEYSTDAFMVEKTNDIYQATHFYSVKEIEDTIAHGEFRGVRVGGWFDFEPISYEVVSVEINVIDAKMITE